MKKSHVGWVEARDPRGSNASRLPTRGSRTSTHPTNGALVAIAVAGIFWLGASLAAFETPGESDDKPKDSGDTIDPLSANATCYICHTMFVREPISKVHFKAKVTCIDCHGLSAAHANDEDIGATKPDVMYNRGQVDKMCSKCHEEHDVPANEVIERFVERKPAQSPALCTDCHGRHKIEPPEEEEPST